MTTLIIIGPPASGKTTVGRLVAQRLGMPFVDTDQVVEDQTGRTVAQVFQEQGEAEFRRLEGAAVLAALAGDGAVVALGGGAVTTPAVREALAGRPVVWLDVALPEALNRSSGQAGQRPLLEGDSATQLAALMEQRRGLYAASSQWRVDTTGRAPDQVADDVISCLTDETVVHVATDHPYDVVVGHGVLRRVAGMVGDAARVAIVTTSAVSWIGERVRAEVEATGAETLVGEVPIGEAAKTPEALAHCWSQLAGHGFTRSDLIIAVGGGATTDMAGLVAATYLRGIAWVAVPTSVLGMVDAAVGGKTGIDIPEGKNLVGAFHEPRAVLADLDALTTLPPEEVRAGLAEVAKEGFTDDVQILHLIEDDPADALDVASDRLAELIVRAVRVKAAVVADDLRERTSTGDEVGRERLNYGHTLAHAIEAHECYRWRHGEAVAVGCVFAAEVAHRVVGLPAVVVQRHRSVFGALGLPTGYTTASWPALRELMAVDKKARGSHLRMVLLRDVGQVTVVADVPDDVLEDAYKALG